MRRLIDQPPRARDRHVVRRRLVQPHLQKLPQAQRIGYPPGDPPLAVVGCIPSKNPISISRKYIPGTSERPPQLLVVEPLAPTLAEPIEVGFFQYPIQPLVERVPRCLGQFGPIPQRLLSLPGCGCAVLYRETIAMASS